ncbi:MULTISPECIES: glycosyltransferase family 2 protein [unclassified Rathayibacter]|uniref:glycosyltransferase family 2 protein n=1 Tax=unclassified Rathayibacter TaxID=2609250 RepID=UPI00188B8A79|nr:MULTISPECIES: glycosyltransferase family 2 protein [unclassified Rathayibacter]MBF4463517.1 glycosyltransferase [Rathayibacter sp. VKM Ac-2879]MBF4504761.1 glycosyltransferase [Rathayibacter sp. VKM Ac-2878]
MRTVSVVIPTIGRHELHAAVTSALAQLHPVHEVLVVADTLDEIDIPDDERVCLVRVGPGAGGNVARQTGIELATGDFIALLDDDDIWFPEKLAKQFEAVDAAEGAAETWIASCRVSVAGHERGALVWPDRLIQPSESLVEYLFLKRKVRGGTGFIQASCLLFPRALALTTPFDRSLRFHQDVSWLVDVAHAHPNLTVVQSPDALGVYLVTPGSGSVSQSIKADASVEWALERLAPDGRRVLGDFILTQSLLLARRAGSPRAVLRIMVRGMSVGRPGLPAVAYGCVSLAKVVLARVLGRRVVG